MLRRFNVVVPVVLDLPGGDDPMMLSVVADVLGGEYEAGYDGENLTILDIGAHVGAFSLWANFRWPHSRIFAYEPDPRTFDYLRSNIARVSNVTAVNAAVYPADTPEASFHSRHAGDVEAGLVNCLARTFPKLPVHRTITVPVRHPRTLPRADIVKLDTEGAEAEILADLDVAATSLILLEFHHRDDLQRIEAQLHGEFEFVRHERLPWQPWLNGSEYRQDLAGDDYGRLFAVRRDGNRLARVAR